MPLVMLMIVRMRLIIRVGLIMLTMATPTMLKMMGVGNGGAPLQHRHLAHVASLPEQDTTTATQWRRGLLSAVHHGLEVVLDLPRPAGSPTRDGIKT